jgi:hypothetical protein
MLSTTYHVVRVNTRNHGTQLKAMDDMVTIIERGFFWKKSERLYSPVGSLIIAAGSYGGRGLFLFGMVTGPWENNPDNADEYTQRVPVLWQPVIYKHDKNAVKIVEDMLTRFNIRFGERYLYPHEFGKVFDFVLSGEKLEADYHWRSNAA